jgi:hypothetical protein
MRRRMHSSFGSAGGDDGRAADRFVADLFGEALPGALHPSGEDSGGPEPFFGDRHDQCWKVVARGGSRLSRGLRNEDLIVERATVNGNTSWQCRVAADVDSRSVFRRGSDGLVRDDVVVLRRVAARHRFLPSLPQSWKGEPEDSDEVIEVAGFFGPNNVRRTEQEVRAAIVTRATAEWTAWHTAAGAPRAEGEAGMFGRLVGYYLAAVGSVLPDSLTALQAAALGENYAAVLASGATASTISAESTRIARRLVAATPEPASAALVGTVAGEIPHARQAHTGRGVFRAWSAAFVVGVVRGAGISLDLEAVIDTARRHVGRDELLRATLRHAEYTIEARNRRAATVPRRRGTYHAFAPRERTPQPGDVIVQDRRDTLTAAGQVVTLPGLTGGDTHGDIVVEVQPGFVMTIGGNVGDSSRKRRYPLDAGGLLVVDRRQLFTQEDDTGALAAVPVQTAAPLHLNSTARIFALLSPVEERAAVPGQPYRGGILT